MQRIREDLWGYENISLQDSTQHYDYTNVQTISWVLFQTQSIFSTWKPTLASFWLLLGGSFSLPFSRMVGSSGALTMVIILLGGSSSLPSSLNAGSIRALALLLSSMPAGSSSLAVHGGEGSSSLSLFRFNIQHQTQARNCQCDQERHARAAAIFASVRPDHTHMTCLDTLSVELIGSI